MFSCKQLERRRFYMRNFSWFWLNESHFLSKSTLFTKNRPLTCRQIASCFLQCMGPSGEARSMGCYHRFTNNDFNVKHPINLYSRCLTVLMVLTFNHQQIQHQCVDYLRALYNRSMLFWGSWPPSFQINITA